MFKISNKIIIKVFIVTLASFIILNNSFAQWVSSPPIINGTVTQGEYGSTADNTNQKFYGGTTFMNWDNNNLYIAQVGAPTVDATIIYIDIDNAVPVNSGSNGVFVGQLYDNTNFAKLPFAADIVIYASHNHFEYRVNSGGSWSAPSNLSMSYADNFSGASDTKEFSIPWNAIGGAARPSSFNFFSYNSSGNPSYPGFVDNQLPNTNPRNYIGTSARFERYYTVSSTANNATYVMPFSRECYVFNNTIDEPNFGAISVYDFTLNSNNKITRTINTANTDWNITGSLVVASSGIIDFGNLGGTSYGNSFVNNLNIINGTIGLNGTIHPLNVSGNLQMAAGYLNLSQASGGDMAIGGNFTKTGGSFNCNQRLVLFNGSTGQQWNSSTSENIDYLAETNTSTGGVIMASNLNAGTQSNIYNSFNIGSGSYFYVASGKTLNFNNYANGAISGRIVNNYGTINIPNGGPSQASIRISNGGYYEHAMDGGSIPPFIWDNGSTCLVSGWKSTTTALFGLGQTFYNFTWNSPSQTGFQYFSGSFYNILGDLTINSTGASGAIVLSGNSAFTLNIGGNFNQTGGNLYLSNGTNLPALNIHGNFVQSGGAIEFNPTSSSQGAYISILGNYTRTGGRVIHTGFGNNGTIYFNSPSGTQNISVSGTYDQFVDYQVFNTTQVVLTSDFQLNNSGTSTFTINSGGTLTCGTYVLSGNSSSTFTMQSASTLKTASLNFVGALTKNGNSLNGSIQTAFRNYNSGANYEFNGNGNQYIGDFASGLTPSFTVNNLTINNSAPLTSAGISLTDPLLNIAGSLILSKGKIATSVGHTLKILASGSISGGSSTSFVDGSLSRELQPNIHNNGTNYIYPLGNGSVYLPCALNNIKTDATTPTVSIQSYNGGVSGTFDGSLTALSNNEYCIVTVNSGNFPFAMVQFGRPTTLGSLNTLANSSAPSGTFTSSGGNIVNANTITSFITPISNSGTTFRFGTLGNLVVNTIVPTQIDATYITNDNSGYVGQTITISGTNFISSGMTVKVCNVVVPYTFVNSTTIKVVVPKAISSGNAITVNNGVPFGIGYFNYLGYITNQSGDLNSASTWLGGSVPPNLERVVLKNSNTLNSVASFSPNTLIISSDGNGGAGGTLTIDPGTNPSAGITINNIIVGGTINSANNSFINIGNGGSYLLSNLGGLAGMGNSYVNFLGSASVSGGENFNNVIINGNVNLGGAVSGYLQINPGGAIIGYAPIYSSSSTLIYNTGGVYSPGLEWNSVYGNGYPNNVVIGGTNPTTIDISTGTNPTNINGKLTINPSSALTFNNCSQSLTVKGDVLNKGSLILSSQSGSNLILYSNFDNRNIFNANNSAVIFNNQAADQFIIPEAPTTFNILTVDKKNNTLFLGNTVSGNIITNISNALNVTSGTFDIRHKNLVLKSNASQTASISSILGAILNADNLTVERYFPAHRTWRLVSVPVSSSAQTINASWQEGQTNPDATHFLDNVPGYGITISGKQPGLGFDPSPQNRPSMLTYDNINDNWVTVPNTISTNINFNNAYLLFVRGNRLATYNQYATTNPTILRTNGTLRQGNIINNIPPNLFTLVANPYPCAIDFNALTRSGSLGNKFTVVDPAIAGTNGVGALVTFTWTGSGYSSSMTPVSAGLGQFIQSGQAFMVQGGINPETLTISESHKVVGSNSTVFQNMGGGPPQIRINLSIKNSDNSYTLEDGTLAVYGDQFSNGLDNTDAAKIKNIRESISLMRENTSLAIEARKPISANDTLYLNINTYTSDYNFSIVPQSLNQPGLSAFLLDNFNKTETILSLTDTTIYKFSVTNDVATQAADRFKIIFKNLSPLPLNFTSATANREYNNIKVEWKIENQLNIKQYEILRSNNGVQFYSIGVTSSKPGINLSYDYLDSDPLLGINYYKIKSLGTNSEINYSNIVKVIYSIESDEVIIYPNPILNEEFNIHFKKFQKGKYLIRLNNNLGQNLAIHSINNHKEGSGVIELRHKLIKGKYQIQIQKPDGSQIIKTVIY